MFLSISPSGSSPTPPSILPEGYTQLKCIISNKVSDYSQALLFQYKYDEPIGNINDKMEISFCPIEGFYSDNLWHDLVYYGINIIVNQSPQEKTYPISGIIAGKTDNNGTFFQNVNYPNMNELIGISLTEGEYNNIQSFVQDNVQYLTINNNTISQQRTYDLENGSIQSIIVGGRYNGSNVWSWGKYEFLKFYNSNNDLILHWLPAMKDDTQEVGFYDIVNNTFILPVQGTPGYETL